jgi:hypothetical protein
MLWRLGGTVAAFAFGTRTANAQTPAVRFQAASHPEDSWLDAVSGKHRTYIDASTPSGAAEAILYANNLYAANKAGYSLPESEIVVVVGLRHFATVFAFTDTIWATYGKVMSGMVSFTDPRTKLAPATNVLTSADYGMALPNFGNTIQSVVSRGTRFAVCDMATHFIAGRIAAAAGGTADAVYKELSSNLIPSARFVAAGVVAVNRAQERGYTLLNTL